MRGGEVVTLLGRNGAGKTTTLKSVMGMVSSRRGSIRFDGHELITLPSNRIARLGLAFCPEERGIFASLNVEENLLLPPEVRPGGLPVDAVFGLFPNLQERLKSQGTKLSGGEQQMLAIARALMGNPRVLLMDEPSEGLAPLIVAEVGKTIARLKGEGQSIVLVEQNVKLAFSLADDVVILNTGRVAFAGPVEAVRDNETLITQHLGVF